MSVKAILQGQKEIGAYNIFLTDAVTSDQYTLLIQDGILTLLQVDNIYYDTKQTMIDTSTGQAYSLIVSDGILELEEVN